MNYYCGVGTGGTNKYKIRWYIFEGHSQALSNNNNNVLFEISFEFNDVKECSRTKANFQNIFFSDGNWRSRKNLANIKEFHFDDHELRSVASNPEKHKI